MVYIHVPFCKSFCRYCAFYSELYSDKMQKAYTEGLVAEALHRREEIEASRGVNTLYIGGGTPSLMGVEFFSTLLQAIPLRDFEEFTIEVNPDDIVCKGGSYVRSLKALGVNRVSMGVQSLDDSVLQWMGRRHSAEEAVEAFGILREAGISNISVDLIFGVNGMSLGMLDATLDGILELHPEHISAYQLGIEDGTPLECDYQKGLYSELDEDSCAVQYCHICKRLAAEAYHHYEISSWALPGFEAKHNSAYWRRVPYVGLGPGAHSFSLKDGRQVRSWNSATLPLWTASEEVLTGKEIRVESIMLGLRTDEGCMVDGKHVTIPEDKWFIADSIISDLI